MTKFLSRPGMPTPEQFLYWIPRLGIKAVALACNVNYRTLQRWYEAAQRKVSDA